MVEIYLEPGVIPYKASILLIPLIENRKSTKTKILLHICNWTENQQQHIPPICPFCFFSHIRREPEAETKNASEASEAVAAQ